MVLIIGGAYQGKLDYVKENFNKSDSDVFFCKPHTTEFDFSKDVICGFHHFVLAQLRMNICSLEFIMENIDKLKNKIIIADDISCGVVPVEELNRAWRETCGRSLALLSKNSESVIRVFCGIGTAINTNSHSKQ